MPGTCIARSRTAVWGVRPHVPPRTPTIVTVGMPGTRSARTRIAQARHAIPTAMLAETVIDGGWWLGYHAVMLIAVAVTVVATGVLVAGHARHRHRWIVGSKPVASAGFVALGLLRFEAGSPLDPWLLAALLLGFAGDQLLLGRRTFTAGLAAFLLGHLSYLRGWTLVASPAGWSLVPLVPLAVVAVGALVWLWPHLGRLRVPVVLYVGAITLMTWGAWGASLAGALPLRCGVGATLFLLSDLTVARERFVHESVANRALGLPCYYAGQLLLASCLGLA